MNWPGQQAKPIKPFPYTKIKMSEFTHIEREEFYKIYWNINASEQKLMNTISCTGEKHYILFCLLYSLQG